MTDGGSSGARWLRTFNTSRNRWHAAAPVAYLKGAELHGAISLRSIPRVRPHRAFEERPSIDGLWGHLPPRGGKGLLPMRLDLPKPPFPGGTNAGRAVAMSP